MYHCNFKTSQDSFIINSNILKNFNDFFNILKQLQTLIKQDVGFSSLCK